MIRTVIVEDTTPPIIENIEDNQIFEAGTEITISFNEGIATLNDEPVENRTVVSEPGNYQLIITDAIGNVTSVTFTIQNTFPYVVILVSIGGVIGGGIVLRKVLFKI